MKKIFRSDSDKYVAGVFGGLGNYFNIDSTILRIGFIILLIPSFFTLSLIYIAVAMIMPKEDIY
ncbi:MULTISPECIES: PspC domain-containing protein [Oceanobacillus]|uniref:Phage shock protein PspC N-terminal domain-containing protein n=1 Tax=Oceanobacillus kimchii TaxID=746691 RepID=A0ABQ5TJU9_9BACI|nr:MULTISPECIES: PspC domain-containing protein [Oceanobacillus]MBT2600109.1 PspC domain-containing protein [Oceanobacillus sp. ISL-74]MBT2650267.1 PspC domain-containing protein [Oceanobacillus sp. ISL-73]MCT1578010.1 PspC domain-containing protein [Oceanobacillus kimchii]MCT2137570.1 PspC domain-containing protein [Oceanobacillus kimchii]OEH55177.1 hypothetical protein AQ616_09025 [Oceanobacillus sp. E9]